MLHWKLGFSWVAWGTIWSLLLLVILSFLLLFYLVQVVLADQSCHPVVLLHFHLVQVDIVFLVFYLVQGSIASRLVIHIFLLVFYLVQICRNTIMVIFMSYPV